MFKLSSTESVSISTLISLRESLSLNRSRRERSAIRERHFGQPVVPRIALRSIRATFVTIAAYE